MAAALPRVWPAMPALRPPLSGRRAEAAAAASSRSRTRPLPAASCRRMHVFVPTAPACSSRAQTMPDAEAPDLPQSPPPPPPAPGSAPSAPPAGGAGTPTPALRPLNGFNPRLTYEASQSITRSYFLGHHHAAVQRMREKLSNIGLIIECRDMRVPLTSWNPTLETELEARSRRRIVVYTKRDLTAWPADRAVVERLRRFHAQDARAQDRDPVPPCLFAAEDDRASTRALLAAVGAAARAQDSLLGMRAMVVGMPNSGKSTLLNRLRSAGIGGGGADGRPRSTPKVARTGAEPGVTRSLGTPVRVLAPGSCDDGGGDVPGQGVFVMDTPGVFVPYVGSAEAMLKLALVGCVRDGLVDWVTLADYLLYQMNLPPYRVLEPRGPQLYERLCPEPTNDVHVFLDRVARRSGKLAAGGAPNLVAAAEWVVQLWRRGLLGRFVLDNVNMHEIMWAREAALNTPTSLNHARKLQKEHRKEMRAVRAKAAKSSLG